MRTWALGQDANGVYQIGTEQDLIDFAAVVSGGTADAKAVLTNDIALTSAWETPIGTAEGAFSGFFDGQGHKITGFEGTSHGQFGLFGFISQAVVQNLTLAGKLEATNVEGTPEGSEAHGAGLIGWAEGSRITGVHSELEITVAAPNVHHVGGVLGTARSSNNVIRCCSFSGSLSEQNGNTDCFGGVVGYISGDSIINCANFGSVSYAAAGAYAGGILGYLNSTDGTIIGCLNTGKITFTGEGDPTYGGAIIGRLKNNTPARHQNSVWLEGSALSGYGENSMASTVCATEEQLASGEMCYYMNTDQTEIGWYQTLKSDAIPVLDATHAQVYMNGRQHCNGDPYEDVIYSNENSGLVKDDHNIVDGFCSYCGIFDETYLTPNADGYYEIASAKQLAWFEHMVNIGKDSLNAVLTADIDFVELMPEGADPEESEAEWTPIGNWVNSAAYRGHFNGQGHTIKNFNVTSNQNYYGIFGVISNGSLVENFDIYGTMNLGHKTGAVVGYTRDTSCTIRNIHSYMTINVTEAATTAERPGGIVGSAVNGKTIVENCTYSGILNVGGHTGNIGGIVGYINNNAAAIVNITNCLFDGEIQNGSSADGQCGGIVGYNNAGKATIKNCLSIGVIVSSEGNIGQLIGRLNGSNTVFANNYYVGDFVNGTKSGKSAGGTAPVKVDGYQLASGEITWKLNEESLFDAVWRQEIGEDEYPQPTSVGAVVYQTLDGYANVSEDDSESFTSFRDDIIAAETSFIEDEELVANVILKNDYVELIKSWESIDNLTEFLAAYKAALEVKESVKLSAASYAAYMQACEAAAEYLRENNMEGGYADFLRTYLEDTVEPNNDYPRGTAPYILENCNLDNDALADEIKFVDQMLQNAIAGGLTPGSEITRLIVNPDFTEGEDKFEGWTKEAGDGATFATGGVSEIMHIARGKDGAFDIKQTVSDLPNGIYMMALNGLFLNGQDIYSQYSAGQLYLNNTYNYFMTSGEDMISIYDAKDKENCLIGNDDEYKENEETIGYVPSSFNGCSYAFSAGRYQNFCATEVTDSTLTIGMRNLGASFTGDWMPFGNMRVYYLGTAEEANETLADVLDGFVARAQVIVDFQNSDGYDDVAMRPNISTDLKERLADAIAVAGEAATGEQKMALINTFSALFNEVYACRRAYIAMGTAAQNLVAIVPDLYNMGILTEEESSQWEDKGYLAAESFADGSVSTEQALALADEMNIMDKLLPQVDGVYQLGSPMQIQLFSVVVNNGQTDAKAVMVNDIDMSEVEDFIPIGNTKTPYTGVFDGQNHKITSFGQFVVEDGETGEGYYTLKFSGSKIGEGFFGTISGATVKNFTIEGAFEVTGGNYKGAIGQALKSTVSNVHSALNIAITASACHHCGGLVGSTESDAGTTISNCSFSGTLTVAAGSTDNFAGVLGYSGNDVVENCANYGTINFMDAGCAAGGIVGYINNVNTSIKNCLNVGTVHCTVSDSPKYGGAIIGRIKNNWGSDRIVNNYWLEGSAYAPAKKDDGSAPAAASATGSTAEQLASGEICYKLNGDQAEINWYQTLVGEDKDAYPVLDPTHSIVLYDETNGYHNDIEDPDGLTNVDVKDNGNLNNAVIFNLAGQRISGLQKGINIIGGKKVVIK